MKNLSYEGLFERWEIAVAKNIVNEFKKRWRCLEGDDFEDLLQECLTHWLFAKDKYNPTLKVKSGDAKRDKTGRSPASEKTFMGRVIRNKLSDIIKERTRDKRKIAQNCVSLDQPLGNEEDASTLLNTLPAGEADFRLRVELQIDLEKALQKLTPRQQRICDLLAESGSTITDIGEYLGLRRKAVYKELERIRKIFQDEGLKNYLD